jgi:hypothetical protein
MEDQELQSLVDRAKALNVWTESYVAVVENCSPEISKDILRGAIARAENAIASAKRDEANANQLAKRDEDIAEHANRFAHLIRACMRETYMKGGIFSLPPITLNNSVKPSISGNERSVTIVNEDGHIVKVKLKIPKAKIKELESQVWLNSKEVKIPFESEDARLATSVLGSQYIARRSKFTYANEFDVQNLAMVIV